MAAARLGADVVLVAALGDDDHGRDAPARTWSARASTPGLVETADAATGIAVVLVDETAENLIALAPGRQRRARPGRRDRGAHRPARRAGGRAGQSRGAVACVEAAAAVAEDRGWTLVLNPAPAPSSPLPGTLLRRVAVLTPNEGELAVCGAGRGRPRCSTPASEPSS